jgi:hypothetical protein
MWVACVHNRGISTSEPSHKERGLPALAAHENVPRIPWEPRIGRVLRCHGDFHHCCEINLAHGQDAEGELQLAEPRGLAEEVDRHSDPGVLYGDCAHAEKMHRSAVRLLGEHTYNFIEDNTKRTKRTD